MDAPIVAGLPATRRWRRGRFGTFAGRVLVAGLVGGVVLVGCGDEPEPATLPPLSPSASADTADTSATTTTTTGPTASPTDTTTSGEERRAVRAVYVASARAFHKAQRLPAARQRAYLAQWEVDPLLGQDLRTLADARKGHYTLVGRPELHILDITVDGDEAVVEDCVDHSGEFWKDSRTGRTIAGSRQPDGVWAFTTLVSTADGWRTSRVSARKKHCDA